jgi:hypothetical protein
MQNKGCDSTLRPIMIYPTDLSDAELELIKPHLPAATRGQEAMSLSVEVVRKPKKPVPEEVAEA